MEQKNIRKIMQLVLLGIGCSILLPFLLPFALGIAIHSDQGTHYTSLKFIQLVESRELRRSMSRRGNCWDNAPQESFFGHMKDELAGEIPGWTSFADAKASIDRWMDYYNQDRCQWDLAKLSPNEFYEYISTGEHPAGMLPQWVK